MPLDPPTSPRTSTAEKKLQSKEGPMQSPSPTKSPIDHDQQMKVNTTKGNAKKKKSPKKVVVRSEIRTKIRRASILHASQEQELPTAPTAPTATTAPTAAIEPQKKVVLDAEAPTQEEGESKLKELDVKHVATCNKKAAQKAVQKSQKNAAHADATNASTAAIDSKHTLIDSDQSSTTEQQADANLEKTMQQTPQQQKKTTEREAIKPDQSKDATKAKLPLVLLVEPALAPETKSISVTSPDEMIDESSAPPVANVVEAARLAGDQEQKIETTKVPETTGTNTSKATTTTNRPERRGKRFKVCKKKVRRLSQQLKIIAAENNVTQPSPVNHTPEDTQQQSNTTHRTGTKTDNKEDSEAGAVGDAAGDTKADTKTETKTEIKTETKTETTTETKTETKTETEAIGRSARVRRLSQKLSQRKLSRVGSVYLTREEQLRNGVVAETSNVASPAPKTINTIQKEIPPSPPTNSAVVASSLDVAVPSGGKKTPANRIARVRRLSQAKAEKEKKTKANVGTGTAKPGSKSIVVQKDNGSTVVDEKTIPTTTEAAALVPKNGAIIQTRVARSASTHSTSRKDKLARLKRINRAASIKREKLRRQSIQFVGRKIKISLCKEEAMGHVAWTQKHFKPLPPPICTSGVFESTNNKFRPSGPAGGTALRRKAPPFPRSRSLSARKKSKLKSMHAPPPPRKMAKSKSAGTISSMSPQHRPLYAQPSWIHEDEEPNEKDRPSSNKKRRRCVIS